MCIRDRPYSPELLEDGLCKIDSYYSGDGWSTDGASVQKAVSYTHLDVYKRQ